MRRNPFLHIRQQTQQGALRAGQTPAEQAAPMRSAKAGAAKAAHVDPATGAIIQYGVLGVTPLGEFVLKG